MIAGMRLVRHGWVASRLRRRSVLVDDAILYGRLAELARRFDLRPPRLLTGADVPGPLLVGIFRPAIVLPAQLLDGERETIDLVLAHELAHVRRRDLWWTWLGAAVGVLFFFHPLVWVARREERAAEEMACDALAIGVSRAAAGDYARALLAVAVHAFAPVPALAVGVVSSRRVLEQRIIAMRHLANWSRRRWTVVAAVVVILGLVAIPPWRVVAQEKGGAGNGDAPAAAGKAPGKDASETPSAAGGERPKTVEERMRARREQTQAAEAAELAWALREHRVVGSIAAATLRIQPAGDGLVERVGVHEGDRVKKGDVLIQLDSRRAQAALARTEAKLALAEAQFSRIRELVKQATVSHEEADQKEAELKVAQADLNVAKQDLWEMQIISPIDGTVGDLSVRAGERVTREQTLVTVVESGALKFYASIPSSELAVWAVGQPVTVRLDIYPKRSFAAQISRIAPTVDPGSKVRIEATLTGDTTGLLPGMSANAGLAAAAPKEGAKQP
jgi:RND family efflux transporter MFP subunit